MPSSETLVRELCSRIVSVPQAEPDPVEGHGLVWLAKRLAAIQNQFPPKATLKGIACFATDQPGCHQGSQDLAGWLEDKGPLPRLSAHCDVKWLVADAGLDTDFANSPFAPHIVPRLLKGLSLNPQEAVWDALQEGVRLACRMKGRGTDLFGACFLSGCDLYPRNVQDAIELKAWPISITAGFLLAAADLQTPIIVSGAPVLSALAMARTLVPAVADYVLLAQPPKQPVPLYSIPPLLSWTSADPIAVILGLDLCQSAAKMVGQ